MRLILQKKIENKEAKLMLCDDDITVKVFYAGELIDSSAKDTWKNISGTDLLEAYLDVIVETFLDNQKRDFEFEKVLSELGWE